jgi:hypothetical protein
VGQETLDQIIEGSLTSNFAVDLIWAVLGELLKRVESSLHHPGEIVQHAKPVSMKTRHTHLLLIRVGTVDSLHQSL